MTPAIRQTTWCGASLAALLLLSACGKEPPATPVTAPAPSASAATASTAALPPTNGIAATPMSAASAAVARSASVAAPAAPAHLSVTALTLGSDVDAQHKVTQPSQRFASNDKAIYASVATEGSSRGATLNATWSYLEGKSQLVSSISQSIATDGPATTTFKVQNPDLWPQGKYQVVISLDGKQVAKQAFEIKQG